MPTRPQHHPSRRPLLASPRHPQTDSARAESLATAPRSHSNQSLASLARHHQNHNHNHYHRHNRFHSRYRRRNHHPIPTVQTTRSARATRAQASNARLHTHPTSTPAAHLDHPATHQSRSRHHRHHHRRRHQRHRRRRRFRHPRPALSPTITMRAAHPPRASPPRAPPP